MKSEKSHFAVTFLSQQNGASVIYTFIFSKRCCCANKTVQRKAPKQYTFSPDDPNTIY